MPRGVNNYDTAKLQGRNVGSANALSIVSPEIITDGLTLHLDAGNYLSYPGSGGIWFDLSGNGYDFNISSSAFSIAGGIAHMNFEGSFGIAKRVVSGALSDIPNFANATIMSFSTLRNSTANWRTFTRGAASDHQVIVQTGVNTLGMYDNTANTFISSGFDVSTLPSPYTQFNCLTWRLSQSSPYYQFQYNSDPTVYSITNANATYDNGFACIGGLHNASIIVTNSDQYWGKVSVFLYYNRALSVTEISQNLNALRARFSI
jgi:hypothetical protein